MLSVKNHILMFQAKSRSYLELDHFVDLIKLNYCTKTQRIIQRDALSVHNHPIFAQTMQLECKYC